MSKTIPINIENKLKSNLWKYEFYEVMVLLLIMMVEHNKKYEWMLIIEYISFGLTMFNNIRESIIILSTSQSITVNIFQ